MTFGLWVSLIIALLFIPGISQDKAWKGSIHNEGGVTTVENPKTPLYSPDVLEPREEYIIKSSGRGYEFVMPCHLVLDENNKEAQLESPISLTRVMISRTKSGR
jgi:hypothetical protein